MIEHLTQDELYGLLFLIYLLVIGGGLSLMMVKAQGAWLEATWIASFFLFWPAMLVGAVAQRYRQRRHRRALAKVQAAFDDELTVITATINTDTGAK
jgi:hypothetical protein